jgi:conjugative transfer signal peptidase TraF
MKILRLNKFNLSISFLILVVIVTSLFPHKKLIWNSTGSLPKGLYYLTSKRHIDCGDIVYFPVPDNVKHLVFIERRWLPEFANLLKEVMAVEGDYVCENSNALQVKNLIGPVSPVDSSGRHLPQFVYCGLLKKDQLFVGDLPNWRSFDSRYFGPVNVKNIKGVAIPIWTF